MHNTEETKRNVLTNADIRAVTKRDQVPVDPDKTREAIEPAIQPPIDIEFVGVFTEDVWLSIVARDVDPDILTLRDRDLRDRLSVQEFEWL